ncbi:ATPase P [Heyndrickxia shackletonii]|uniref:P-type Cu(+) transporter n=1 Tax=Heyndrickxia shackletonii TaxID=157838 RepID=A0A0Q3WWV5_9BACI|nr:heavy metal translocating P-type ATPase [Heyndrickxia shackletonii]KQL53356.1 ATPase P [Heyndrickxia shackletonii]NEZ01576.1 copper-translocating P-type ATPase [Heyndrickxia shackletonii]
MIETIHLNIDGMYCSACSGRIEKSVLKLEGIFDVNINLATEKGRVVYDSAYISNETILERIKKLGYIPTLINQKDKHVNKENNKEITSLTWKVIVSIIFSLPLVLTMFVQSNWINIELPQMFFSPWFQLMLATPVQFIIAFPFYEGAWNAIKNRGATMDVLVVISTTSAYFYSHYLTVLSFKMDHDLPPIHLHYETSVLIITFVLIGKLIEVKTKRKTMDAIHSLNKLKANSATIILNGKEIKKSIGDINPGDVVIVKAGEKIPIDGQVMSGLTTVNESMLTGESIPIEKKKGKIVYAGTINLSNVITLKATKKHSETLLSKIIDIVEEAQLSKPPIQNIADRFTAFFVPVVLILGMVTFLLWYFILAPGVMSEAMEKMIAVLIISCPCALGLATPLSIMVGSGRAAKLGILFKEGKMIELLGKNNIVVLDKTGTITKGKLQVTDILVRDMEQNLFLQLVGSVEKGVNHPIGNSIADAIEKKINDIPTAASSEVMIGYGVKGIVMDRKIKVASVHYFEKHQKTQLNPVYKHLKKMEGEGKTVMLVSIDNRIHGIIAVRDEIKKTAKKAITRLKGMGLKIVMLSGDNPITTKSIANITGIKHYKSEVSPQGKANWIKDYQKAGNRIIMVGDGINDAPALSVANVGVGLGTGTDIAIEAGDITIMNGDLNRVADAISISKKTMINIKQNFAWAFMYNLICIPLAMMGILPPWFASAAMAFSSVSVVLNSLRLKNI